MIGMAAAGTHQEIEVGATDGDLRYWLAKEAIRQAELVLASQADSRRSFEARVTAILGWIVATSALISAAALTAGSHRMAAASALAPLLIAAAVAIALIWPGWWGHAGHDPKIVVGLTFKTVLECLESMAGGYQNSIDANSDWLLRASVLMRCIYILAAVSPLLGGILILVNV
jgi:hypothetical protein